MNEIEVKIIDINIDIIKQKLESIQAVKVKMENQINNIFDFPDERLLSQKGYARIRVVEDLLNNKTVNYMTTKKMISQEKYKVMEEKEVLINDGKTGEDIFISLGLVLKGSIKKYRESYKYKNTLIEIDINDKSFCPFPYIEIESPTGDELEEVVNLLGYTIQDTTSKTIYEILSGKGVMKGI